LTFDTGFVDANSIGINDPYGYKFRRSTTCTPLNTEHPYVHNETANGTAAFTYYYGETGNKSYTYHSTGDPFNWLSPNYHIRLVIHVHQRHGALGPHLLGTDTATSIQFTSRYANTSNWKPIPALNRPPNTTLTIMFITPMHIRYLHPSNDPIFTVNKEELEGSFPIYYKKHDAKYRVLACIDSHEICSPDERCSSMTDLHSANMNESTTFPPQYWLMKWSLEHSDIYHSIAKRLGAALVARHAISQYTSMPLSDRHWVVEARRLFETSLARIQLDAWGIGSGEDRVYKGEDWYHDEKPAAVGDLCGIIKFQSTGYINIGIWIFCLVIMVMLLVWFLNWRLP